MQGDLKNFFVTSCTATYKGEAEKLIEEDSGMRPVYANMTVLEFGEVNVNFSATNSTLRAAEVSFRTITVDDEEILELTIDDYEPTDFLTDEYGLFGDTESLPLRLYFTRVN